jgi:hypothetical protein
MFERFFEWLGWKKKEEPVSFVGTTEDLLKAVNEAKASEVPVEAPAPTPIPFTIPNPAELYKVDEVYDPYKGPVDKQLEDELEVALRFETEHPIEPLADPPPSLDFLNKPVPVAESEPTSDPLLIAAANEITKEHNKRSVKKVTPPKKKDPMVAATAKALTKQSQPKKAPKKKAVKKTAKKTKRK